MNKQKTSRTLAAAFGLILFGYGKGALAKSGPYDCRNSAAASIDGEVVEACGKVWIRRIQAEGRLIDKMSAGREVKLAAHAKLLAKRPAVSKKAKRETRERELQDQIKRILSGKLD